MSVLFSNTRTCLLYNEREIFNTARSEPFNIQFELTAGDRLTMASRPTCLNEKTMNNAQFLCVIVITHSVTTGLVEIICCSIWVNRGACIYTYAVIALFR